MGNIVKKEYYKIAFKLASPLCLGSGENSETDKDILKDSRGIPFIPGSAIAGVCRDSIDLPEKDIKEYFGDVEIATKEKQKVASAKASKVLFYDAVIVEGNPIISVRDGVGLDEFRTAIDGAKFDMEVLEPGVTFETFIEQNFENENEKSVASLVADEFINGRIFFGAKTMRGYGSITNVCVKKCAFLFDSKENTEAWLDFDMYSESDLWEPYLPIVTKKDNTTLVFTLKQVGGISIRKYITEVRSEDEKIVPDQVQLMVSTDGEVLPTVPGSSWAGAFRHHMSALGLSKEEIANFFGKEEGNKDKKRSRIRFSETVINGASEKTLSRNAIDRFSGGTVGTALFTERTYYNGETELTISIEGDVGHNVARLLSASICDLNNGFLSVGGLSSIGRGVFAVTSLNGKNVKNADLFECVMSILSKEDKQ